MQRRSFARGLLFLFAFTGLWSGCAPKRLPPLEPGTELPHKDTSLEVPTLLGVGLVEGRQELLLSTNGAAVVLDSQNNRVLFRLGAEGGQLKCVRQGDQVVWSVANKRSKNVGIILQPADPSKRVTHDDKDYRGEFLVIPSPETDGLTLVNQVGLESYLCGVVPWEIGRHGKDKKAALAAQAVAARTYTISHLGSRRSRGFDVYASVMDQVYKGSRHEDPLCNEAIEETAGLVLKSQGKLVDAYYSACCGGHSSRVEKVWPRKAESYLVANLDSPGDGQKAFCSESKYFNWSESWKAGRLEETLQKTLPEYVSYMTQGVRPAWARPMFTSSKPGVDVMKPGKLLDLEITDYTPSGRVAQLLISTEAGTYHIKGDRVRWVLKPPAGGTSILRSAGFELEKVRRHGELTDITVRGRGFGHGIGLCQTGALEMAARGYSAAEILTHYYRGSSLHHLENQ